MPAALGALEKKDAEKMQLPCTGTENVVLRQKRENIQGETSNRVVPDSAGGT